MVFNFYRIVGISYLFLYLDYTFFLNEKEKCTVSQSADTRILSVRSASVVRSNLGDINGEHLSFFIKSGTYPEFGSIITVERTLDDFLFLRQQVKINFHLYIFLFL